MIRIGTEKVRTGCITCKRRRVKCDEAHPRCARCTKAGRACEGYTNVPGRPGPGEAYKFVVYTPTQGAQHHLSHNPDLDWLERRSLSFFQDRTALELAGAFQTDFWLGTILSLAQQDPSVRHALIALSSMHEHYAAVDHFAPARGIDFALDHYGKAIREVVRLNNNTQAQAEQSFDYALVTCALFSSFESLQGNYHTACKHAISGLKMLAEEQRQAQSCSGSSSRSPRVRISRDELTRFFTSIGRQMLEIGDPNFMGPRPAVIWGAPSMPERFTSFEEALLHIEVLLTNLFDFAESTDKLAEQGPIPEVVGHDLMLEYMSIKEYAKKWSEGLEVLMSEQGQGLGQGQSSTSSTPESVSSRATAAGPGPSRPLTKSSTTPPSALLLRAYQSVLEGFLRRIEVNDEAVLDEHMSSLWTCLEACEKFVQQTSQFVTPVSTPTPAHSSPITNGINGTDPTQQQQQRVVRPTYSLALGVVPMLFLLATRGNNMPVRRRAIDLLKQCKRREGFWDSDIAARLSERIFDIQALIADKYGPEALVDFKLLDISFVPGRKCVVRYKFNGTRPKARTSLADPLWAGYSSPSRDGGKEYYETLEWEGVRGLPGTR
ncbi:hypothetical protein LTR23_003990 [Exophiala sp. CCFEE 6169]|nr:hypothetical protein LTR23_003990 [Chaetothyriales sp. CCFEE 6169]